ncbi:MAG: S8 family peptidase [Pseudomonadota bacterium]
MATAAPETLPLLIFAEPTPVQREGGQGFPSSVHFPSHARQGIRLGARFTRLKQAFDARRLELRARTQNDDPDLVLVLETVGTVADFISAARGVAGLEWLAGMDGKVDPDEDFYDNEDGDKALGGKVFLVGSNRAALDDVVRLWERFDADPTAKLGERRDKLEAWKEVFKHLKDARFWGPADRLEPGLRDAWRFRIEHGDATLRFEIDAWHFESAAKNTAAAAEIRALVTQFGGVVHSESLIDEIAYHGFLVSVPSAGVAQVLADDASPLLKSDRVMFFRPHGQVVMPVIAATERVPGQPSTQRTDGTPIVALLDGLPIANHPLLQGRVVVDDPDSWADDYPAAERIHGTAMTSLIALGDLGAPGSPLARPIYARPIMRPTGHGGQRGERTPDDRLLIDLVHVAVRRIFEREPGRPAAAPDVKVVNLSVGDPYRYFTGELSPWARLLDWLQHKYNVLFVVSAGNQIDDLLVDTPAGTLLGMTLAQRSALATRAICRDDMHRRVLAPAESVNALTVGASHSDASTVVPAGGRFQLFADGGLAPYSSIGPGFRRAVKPDILLPGGRVLYREATISPAGRTKLQPIESVQPPGQLVAAHPTPQGTTVYTRGTSNACALGTRWAARAHSVLEVLRAGNPALEAQYDTVLIKALLAHGARLGSLQAQILDARPDVADWLAQRRLVSRYAGLGVADVERALTCSAQRATLLGVGQLRNDKALEFRVPIPRGLHATVVGRRVTATLAWMTPINPRHSKYRVARLWVDLPDGDLRGDRAEGEMRQLRLGTVHHEVFEGARAVPVDDDTYLSVRVNCVADAGRIVDPIAFALCVSLEVAEGVEVPIYEQVRDRVAPRVGIRDGGAG